MSDIVSEFPGRLISVHPGDFVAIRRAAKYTNEPFQRLIADHGIVCSISRSGNVWDNAAIQDQ